MAASILNDPTILSQLQPEEYYRRWMETCFPRRPDGRTVDEARPTRVLPHPVNSADSSAMATVGSTTAVAGVRWEVAEAAPGRTTGYHVVNVTLCAGCSPSVRAGPPGDRAQALSSQMATVLCRLLPEASLSTGQEDLLWVLHTDVLVLNDAGNVFAAVWLAAVGALKLLRLPELRIDSKVGMVYHSQVEDPTVASGPKTEPSLRWKCVPLPLSLAYFPEQDAYILDPTDGEEAILGPAHVTLLLDQDNYEHALLVDSTGVSNVGALLAGHLSRYAKHLDGLKQQLARLETGQ